MLITYLFQEIGYLYFHIVGDGLVVLDACILAFKLFLVLLVNQRTHHSKHTMHAFCEMHDFLLCLEHRNFWCLYHTAADKVQGARLFGLRLTFR